MANDVVELDEFKTYLGTELVENDEWLQSIADAAVSGAGTHCHRRFVRATGSPTSRVYRPKYDLVYLHDFVSLTSVSEYSGGAVSLGDVQLEPLNGLTKSGVAVPYTRARHLYRNWYCERRRATITAVADWGWASFPDEVKQAVLMLGKDIRMGRDASFGIVAMTDYAAIRARENVQVAGLLHEFKRESGLMA